MFGAPRDAVAQDVLARAVTIRAVDVHCAEGPAMAASPHCAAPRYLRGRRGQQSELEGHSRAPFQRKRLSAASTAHGPAGRADRHDVRSTVPMTPAAATPLSWRATPPHSGSPSDRWQSGVDSDLQERRAMERRLPGGTDPERNSTRHAPLWQDILEASDRLPRTKPGKDALPWSCGECIAGRGPDRQTAELYIRIALMNRFSGLSIAEIARVA